MKKLVFSVLMAFVVLSGFNTGNNLRMLVWTNPNYDAEWWKVGLALAMAVFWSGWAWQVARRP